LLGNIYFNGKLVKEFKAEFPMKNGLKRNKFIGGGVLGSRSGSTTGKLKKEIWLFEEVPISSLRFKGVSLFRFPFVKSSIS